MADEPTAVSLELMLHNSFRDIAQKVFAEYGVILEGVRFDWSSNYYTLAQFTVPEMLTSVRIETRKAV